MGAIVAPVQLERIRSLVEEGRKEGAEMWQPSWACPQEGCFYPPTLFTNVQPSSTIAQVEIFGPVLVTMHHGADRVVKAKELHPSADMYTAEPGAQMPAKICDALGRPSGRLS